MQLLIVNICQLLWIILVETGKVMPEKSLSTTKAEVLKDAELEGRST